MAQTSPVKDPKEPLKQSVINQAALDLTTDASGDVAIVFPQLKEVYWALLEFPIGYIANVRSISGNAVTVRVFKDVGAAADPFVAVTSENINATAKGIAVGR